MPFVKQFLGKEASDPETRITANDVDSFIKQKSPVEENSNLDYKAIPPKTINFDELAKDVSAFANSNGGLLILGVSEKVEEDPKTKKTLRIYPGKITWGNASLKKEVIEQHLVGKIHAPLTGIIIIPIRKSEQDHRVIFLIDVLKSDNPPHMVTPYKKYYRRLDFSNVPMEHYEIQNLFRINWQMKDKLVEKIYEPVSEALNKHIKELGNYPRSISITDIEKILTNTYYVRQMPFELNEQIDDYIVQIKPLNKNMRENYKTIDRIILRNSFKFAGKPLDQIINKLLDYFQLIASSENQRITIFTPHILLLKNETIQSELNNFNIETCFTHIIIRHQNDDLIEIQLKDFEEKVWAKCLKEVSENTEIKK